MNNNKYHAINTMEINRMRVERQRKRILAKRIRSACWIIVMLSMMYLIGIAGGLEHDNMTIGQFVGHAIPTIAVMCLSVRIAIGLK